MNYRADIQILRGISVLLVVLYHLQIGIIKSGFLGVDIFFVISGFLMAVLYNSQPSANQTKPIWSFWQRRARRILPAYFATLIITLIISFFILYPAEFTTLVKHSLFSSWLVPNIGFWLENGYFDDQSFRPLLHFWSLGIEIQFYLIVPLLFLVLQRSPKWLIAATIASFMMSYLIAGRSPNSAFFQLGTRFWEFMFGFFCAYYLTNQGQIKHSNKRLTLLTIPALLLLVILCNIDFGIGLRHPASVAALACFLAATILTFGLPDGFTRSIPGQCLEYIGKLSYSIYLVHYPIILLIAYSPFQGALFSDLTALQYSVILVAILITSFLMYHGIESPCRKPHRFNTLGTWLCVMLLCTLLALTSKQLQRTQYSPQQLAIFDSTHDRTTFRCGELFNLTHLFSFSCALTDNEKNANKRYLLVGNSHADAIKVALSNVAKQHHSSLRLARHNFALGAHENTPQNILQEVNKHAIDAVIIHSSPNFLNMQALKTLIELAKQHNFELHYIDPIPTWNNSVPLFLWQDSLGQQPAEQKNLGYYYKQTHLELFMLASIKDPIFKRYSPAKILCQPLCKTTTQNGAAVYYDSHHLTLAGARLLTPLFEKILSHKTE